MGSSPHNLKIVRLGHMDHEQICLMGEEAFGSMHGTDLTKKAIGMLMVLAYNLMDNSGRRLMKEYDPILVDIVSSISVDDMQEVKLCKGQMKSMLVNFSDIDGSYLRLFTETCRRRAFGYCYLAASYLRLFAKSAYNYEKVGKHLKEKFTDFYSFKFPFDEFHPDIDVIKAIKEQFVTDSRFRNTLYVILSSGCAEPVGENIKDFLYKIHLSYAGLHTYDLFVQAMKNLGAKFSLLANSIHTPLFDPQLEAIYTLLGLEHSHDPKYQRHMWKFGRLFDRNFMCDLQIKNCVTFGLVLAYIVSETSGGANKEGPLKIAELRESSSGDRDKALAMALRTIVRCNIELLGPNHAVAAMAPLIGRKRLHME